MCYNLIDMKPTIDTTHPEAVKEWDYGKNDTTPNNYTHGSKYKAYWICPVGHSYTATITNKCSKGSTCPYCSGRLPIPGETDLATTHPELAQELLDADPTTFKAGSNDKVSWKCARGHIFESRVCSRAMMGARCPYCSGRLPIVGETDLATTHPELSEEMVDTDPTTVKAGTNKNALWHCKKGHEYSSRISHRALRGIGCPYCSGRNAVTGNNDIGTTHPHLAKQLKDQTLLSSLKANTAKKVEWVCDRNHVWSSSPNNRVKGSGCPYCSGRIATKGVNNLEYTHPEMYGQLVTPDTSLMFGSVRPVDWVCSKGHTFSASPNHRTKGANTYKDGCPKCGRIISKSEEKIVEFLSENYKGTILKSNRTVLGGLELDIYLPDLNTAIEFNGVYFHSEKFKDSSYHKNKADKCVEAGVRLITVWEDDYNLRKDVVHKMLIHKLGLSAQDKVPARKTEAVFISNQEAFGFLNDNHIQGKAQGSYYLGLKTKDTQELVAVMVLKRTKDVLSLERFATSKIVSGGQSKLLKFVDQNIEYSKMITFADRTVSDGNLYTGTGWVKEAEIAPDYRYLVRNVREHKFGYRKSRFKNDPNLKYVEGYTERQLAELNGLLRVYDAGKVRFSRVPQFRGRIDN